MSTRIIKLYETETSHIVRKAISERCAFSAHGHSYKWEIAIEGPINPATGMILDFKELADIKQQIDQFDHAHVFWSEEDPKIIDFFKTHFRRVLIMKKNPTAENMARWAHRMTQDWLSGLKSRVESIKGYRCAYVRLWETRTGSAYTDESDETDNLVYIHEDN